MGKPSIFISYSRKDTEFVKRLAKSLEQEGYDPWWDIADLRGGQTWAAEIEKHVRACDAAVIVLSPDSNRSEWVGKETLKALELKKTIIPVKWRESELPFPLVDRQFVDFRDRYDEALRDLCQALPPATASIRTGPPAKSTASIYKIVAAVAAIVVLGGLIWKFVLRPASPSSMPAQAVPVTSTAVPPTRVSEAGTLPAAAVLPTATPPTATIPPTATMPPTQHHRLRRRLCLWSRSLRLPLRRVRQYLRPRRRLYQRRPPRRRRHRLSRPAPSRPGTHSGRSGSRTGRASDARSTSRLRATPSPKASSAAE